MTEFLNSEKAMPYCPGCGHPHVLRGLDEALTQLGMPRERITLVTDIGCVGLADSLFPTTHTVHTLHGRSVAIASGLQMGDPHRDGPPLKPIVLIGDGGVGLGLLHVVHAAQMNVDVTVLVHNNLIYGMTGGQHSVLTPEHLKTTTTPDGSPIPPLDLGAVLMGAGAGFFARVLAPGAALVPTITEAISHPGFACVEIMELCPTFAMKKGGVTGKTLRNMIQERGLAMGVLKKDTNRVPFLHGFSTTPVERKESPKGVVPDRTLRKLDHTVRLVVTGRAGERVQSAANLAATVACAAGLQVTVRNDNPVTQGTGFSLAEVNMAPETIHYTGLEEPDLVIATAPEGVAELRARGLLRSPGLAKRYVFDAELEAPEGINVVKHPFRKTFGGANAALGALVSEINGAGWFDPKAWEVVVAEMPPDRQKDVRMVLDKVGTLF